MPEDTNREMATEQSYNHVSSVWCILTKETLAHFPAVTVSDLTRWKLAVPKETVDLTLELVSQLMLLAVGCKSARLCRGLCVGTCWYEAARFLTGIRVGYFAPYVGRHVTVKQLLPLAHIRVA